MFYFTVTRLSKILKEKTITNWQLSNFGCYSQKNRIVEPICFLYIFFPLSCMGGSFDEIKSRKCFHFNEGLYQAITLSLVQVMTFTLPNSNTYFSLTIR